MTIKHAIVSILLLIAFSLFQCSDSSTDPEKTNEISIGALVPLSGDYENQGAAILAALNCAVEDINKEFETNKKNTRIKLVASDTETDPITAKTLLASYIAQNIRITIGPSTSVEVNGVKDEIDASDNLLISPSSTLTSLSIADDNIYRFVPDDSKMVDATVDVMWEQGIRSVAMFYVDNAWGQSFVTHMQEAFEAKGGTYLGDAAFIGSRRSELKEYLTNLSEIVAPAVSSGDPSTVAIQMISLDVGSTLLDLASEDTTLAKAKWFGCDGFVNTDDLFQYYANGSEFGKNVEFTSPIFGSAPTEASQALAARIFEMTNSQPGAYPLVTYDALIVAAKVLDETGNDATLAELKQKLASVSASYSGVTGDIHLNEAGDRANGAYFFWKIVEDGGSYKWEHIITYADGQIIQ